MQMVFQDPFGSLDPRRPVGDQIGDGLQEDANDASETGGATARRGAAGAPSRAAHVRALLAQVGLRPDQACRLPHEFSGGQR